MQKNPRKFLVVVLADSGEKLLNNGQKDKWPNVHKGSNKDWMIKLKNIIKIRLKIKK